MYVYCNNNPVNYVDYTGENSIALKWVLALPTLDGPLPIGDILFWGAVAVFAVIAVCEIVEAASAEAPSNTETKTGAPPQSIATDKEESVTSTPTINEAEDTKENSKHKGKKVAPRIKSNSKKAARQKAFYKGGKLQPIHHPHGKYGPHFHPNNPKFSHWHYYYVVVFASAQLKQEE